MFDLLISAWHHAPSAWGHTQSLDGNSSYCGPLGNNCSGEKALDGPVARSTAHQGFYKEFLNSPSQQAAHASQQQAAMHHIDRSGTGEDFTGISSKQQIAAARDTYSHPLVQHQGGPGHSNVQHQGGPGHSNAFYNTKKPPVPLHKVWADKTGMGNADREAVGSGKLPSHTHLNGLSAHHDWMNQTYISGEDDGYPALSAHKVNAGNKAMYLLAKGMGHQGRDMSFAMDTNTSKEDMGGFVYSHGGSCPGPWCPYAPQPHTQWQNPTYASK